MEEAKLPRSLAQESALGLVEALELAGTLAVRRALERLRDRGQPQDCGPAGAALERLTRRS